MKQEECSPKTYFTNKTDSERLCDLSKVTQPGHWGSDPMHRLSELGVTKGQGEGVAGARG